MGVSWMSSQTVTHGWQRFLPSRRADSSGSIAMTLYRPPLPRQIPECLDYKHTPPHLLLEGASHLVQWKAWHRPTLCPPQTSPVLCLCPLVEVGRKDNKHQKAKSKSLR